MMWCDLMCVSVFVYLGTWLDQIGPVSNGYDLCYLDFISTVIHSDHAEVCARLEWWPQKCWKMTTPASKSDGKKFELKDQLTTINQCYGKNECTWILEFEYELNESADEAKSNSIRQITKSRLWKSTCVLWNILRVAQPQTTTANNHNNNNTTLAHGDRIELMSAHFSSLIWIISWSNSWYIFFNTSTLIGTLRFSFAHFWRDFVFFSCRHRLWHHVRMLKSLFKFQAFTK